MQSPVTYSPDIEKPADDEVRVIEEINQTLRGILDTTLENYGHAVRAVHAKSHGLIEGNLEVLPGLPPALAQGMFAQPGRYKAFLRFSVNPGDLLPDSVSLPRGLALKVVGVEGPRLPGAEGDSQDFVMVNGPVFGAQDPAAFLRSLRATAATTDRATWAKVALSKTLRGAEKALEWAGGESDAIKALGGAPNVHPLGETYFSQTPYRYGEYVAKFQLLPISPLLMDVTGVEIDASDDPDAIRHAVDATMRQGEGVWELRVQLCRDLERMPVEDPSVLWPEEISPFEKVAVLRAAAQPGWTEERVAEINEQLRFSPWTGLQAHRPLGAINRARGPAYAMSSRFRERANGCPIHEPRLSRVAPT